MYGARRIERGDGKPGEEQARAILLGMQEAIMGVRFLVSDRLQGVIYKETLTSPKVANQGRVNKSQVHSHRKMSCQM